MPSTIAAGTTAGTAIAIAGDTTGALALQTNGTTTAMTIDTSQNVGIGTTSPDGKVDISGGGLTSSSIALTNNDNSTISAKYNITFQADRDNNIGGRAFIWRFGGKGYTDGTAQMQLTQGGLLQFNSGYGSVATAYGCRAWVNFNGTGTVAIRGSGNVTSITDNGTGAYAVNFTNAMPDANYGANVSTSSVPGTSDANFITTDCNNTALVAPTTTSFAMTVFRFQGAAIDAAYVRAAVFR